MIHNIKTMKNFNTIVISGGALKGFAILGVIQYLWDHNLMSNVNKFIGTSVGSIISYLLCIGYTPVEIVVHLCQKKYIEKLSEVDVFKAIQGYGAVSFSVVTEMLEKMTIEKIGTLITLSELWKRFDKKLICCSFNYTKQCTEFLNHENHPDLPCIVAIRMSSNLPILFEPYYYDFCHYLDGAIICNFPLHYINPKTDRVIGIKFKKPNLPNDKKEFTGKDFIHFLYDLMLIPSENLETHLTKNIEPHCNIIEIEIDESQSFNFNMSKTDRLEMFSMGYDTAKKHFLLSKN